MHSSEGANNPKNRLLVRMRIPQTRLNLASDPHAIVINFCRWTQFQECRSPIFRVAGLRFKDLEESSAPPREPTGYERLGYVPRHQPAYGDAVAIASIEEGPIA
jgi:hypothetical protein